MSKQIEICPVCGKQFTPCQTILETMINWRRIVCSRECYLKWCENIEAERANNRRQKNNE